MNISHALLQALALTGMKPDELAGRLGMDPTIIIQFCRGSRPANEEQIRQLAAALGCEASITVQFSKKDAPPKVYRTPK